MLSVDQDYSTFLFFFRESKIVNAAKSQQCENVLWQNHHRKLTFPPLGCFQTVESCRFGRLDGVVTLCLPSCILPPRWDRGDCLLLAAWFCYWPAPPVYPKVSKLTFEGRRRPWRWIRLGKSASVIRGFTKQAEIAAVTTRTSTQNTSFCLLHVLGGSLSSSGVARGVWRTAKCYGCLRGLVSPAFALMFLNWDGVPEQERGSAICIFSWTPVRWTGPASLLKASMLQYQPHFSSCAVCLQLKSSLLEQRMFSVVWHQCLPSMPCNGARTNMMQHHVRHQCAAAIVFRATGVKSHDIYRSYRQFSHWDNAFAMRLCLKGRFPSTGNYSVRPGLRRPLCWRERHRCPFTACWRGRDAYISATETKEQHVLQVSLAPSEFLAHVCETQCAPLVATSQWIKAVCGSRDPISPTTKLFQIYFTESPKKVSKVKSVTG